MRRKLLETLTLVTLLILLSMIPPMLVVQPAHAGEKYEKWCMPDLGQHSSGWCWVAAAANSFYWFSQHGYPELIDDPAAPGVDQKYITDPLVDADCPTEGYYRLLDEICKSTWKDSAGNGDGKKDPDEPLYTFCEMVESSHDYVVGLRAFIAKQGAKLEVKRKWGATFKDYRDLLKISEDVILGLEDYGGVDEHHLVTGYAYFVGFPQPDAIEVSDPWTPDAPDHNNDLDHDPLTYDYWDVVDDNPFVIEPVQDITGGPKKGQDIKVREIFYISPPGVGGIWVPVDKLGLLAPYIGLASTLIVATAATTIYVKRRKKQ